MKIGCVVMASGLGKRFGGNKLLQPFRGKPMICWILDAAGEAAFDERIVVTRHEEIARLCREKNIPVICHDFPLRSDTVRLGLSALLEKCPELDGCLFAAGDQPCLKGKSLQTLLENFTKEPNGIHRLSFEGEPGNPVLFPADCFPELLSLPVGKGGSVVIRAHMERVQLTEVSDARELMDVDTPETLQYLQSLE